MRFLISLAAVIIATVTVVPEIAEACGGYSAELKPAPRVLLVANEFTGQRKEGSRVRPHRSFVVLENQVSPTFHRWEALWKDSYNSARIRKLARLDAPMEMTLIGPSGVRVVSSDRQVALMRSRVIAKGQIRAAVEVTTGDDDFRIAIVGRARDAKWFSPGWITTPADAIATPAEPIHVRALAGTGYDIVEPRARYYGAPTWFALRRGDVEVGRYAGKALGAATIDGRFFVVRTDNDGQIATSELAVSST